MADPHPSLEQLECLMDGVVDPSVDKALLDHVAVCAECRNRLARLRVESTILRDALIADSRSRRTLRVRLALIICLSLSTALSAGLALHLYRRHQTAGEIVTTDGRLRLQNGSQPRRVGPGTAIPHGSVLETSYAQVARVDLSGGSLDLNELTRVRLGRTEHDGRTVLGVELLRGEVYLRLSAGRRQIVLLGPDGRAFRPPDRYGPLELRARVVGQWSPLLKDDQPGERVARSTLEVTVAKGAAQVETALGSFTLEAPFRALVTGPRQVPELVRLETLPPNAWQQMDREARSQRLAQREALEASARTLGAPLEGRWGSIETAVAIELAGMHRRLAREEPDDRQAVRHLDAALIEYDRALLEVPHDGRHVLITIDRATAGVDKALRLWSIARDKAADLSGEYGRSGLEARWALDHVKRVLAALRDERIGDSALAARLVVVEAAHALASATIDYPPDRKRENGPRIERAVERLSTLIASDPPAHLQAAAYLMRARGYRLLKRTAAAQRDYECAAMTPLFALTGRARGELARTRAQALLESMRLMSAEGKPAEALAMSAPLVETGRQQELAAAGVPLRVLHEIRGQRISAMVAQAAQAVRTHQHAALDLLERARRELGTLTAEGYYGALRLEGRVARLEKGLAREEASGPQGISVARERALSRFTALVAVADFDSAETALDDYLALAPPLDAAARAMENLAVAYLTHQDAPMGAVSDAPASDHADAPDRGRWTPSDRSARAAALFRRMLDVNPHVADDVYEQVAAHLYRAEDYEGAADVMARLVARMDASGDPTTTAEHRRQQALQWQGHCLYRARRWQDCVDTYRRIEDALPRLRLREYAAALESTGELMEALECWERLTSAGPGENLSQEEWVETQLHRCRLLLRLGRNQEVLRHIKALRDSGDDLVSLEGRFDEMELQAMDQGLRALQRMPPIEIPVRP